MNMKLNSKHKIYLKSILNWHSALQALCSYYEGNLDEDFKELYGFELSEVEKVWDEFIKRINKEFTS